MANDFWQKIKVLFDTTRQPAQPVQPIYAPSQQQVVAPPTEQQRSQLSIAEKEAIIHEAGRRRVLLEMKYDGVSRLVEPYSFRMRHIGGRQFYGHCLLHNKTHSFKMEKIEDIKLTDWPFTPRWEIEL